MKLDADAEMIAAPLVAGVIANFLSQNPVPFALGDGQTTYTQINARDFVAAGNPARDGAVKVIWNHVPAANNPPS